MSNPKRAQGYWIQIVSNGWIAGFGNKPPGVPEDKDWRNMVAFNSRDALIAWLRARLKEDAARARGET